MYICLVNTTDRRSFITTNIYKRYVSGFMHLNRLNTTTPHKAQNSEMLIIWKNCV